MGGSPRAIWGKMPAPSLTRPKTVYWLLRLAAAAKVTKNCEPFESLLWARAIPMTPAPSNASPATGSVVNEYPGPPLPQRERSVSSVLGLRWPLML